VLIEEFFKEIWKQLLVYGPLGVFLVSIVGNAIPYATIPYLIIIAQLASAIPSPIYIVFISVLGGIGATIGKMIIYLMGRAASVIISDEAKRNLNLFARIAERGMFIVIILFAALPLPDDVIYVPLAISGYDPIKYFIAILLGKIFITFVVAGLGGAFGFLMQASNVSWWISSIIFFLISMVFTYGIYLMDWSRIVEDADKWGWTRIIILMLRNPRKYIRKKTSAG